MTEEQTKALIRRMDAYLRGESQEAIAIIKDARTAIYLTQRPAAQAGDREAFEAWTQSQPYGKYPLRRDQEGQYQADETDVAWDAWQARASLPTQPAAQATPEPVGAPIKWWNGCDKSVPDALRFLANNPRPAGGSDRYNAEHLFQLAGEIERMARQPLFTHPAPGVPEGWHMDREGDDVIVVRHQAVGLARATNPATSMHGQILFALCDDILQDRKSLAAAQAKGGKHD